MQLKAWLAQVEERNFRLEISHIELKEAFEIPLNVQIAPEERNKF